MEAANYDPNRLISPEAKELARKVYKLIERYDGFEKSLRQAEKSYAGLNDAVRTDGAKSVDYPREWSAKAEQEAMERFSSNLDVIKNQIEDIWGEKPLFTFAFLDPIGDVATLRGHSVSYNERTFTAREILPANRGTIRLIGQSDGEEIVVPADSDFLIELEGQRAEASSL